MLYVKITTGVQLILRTQIKAVDITTETFAVYQKIKKTNGLRMGAFLGVISDIHGVCTNLWMIPSKAAVLK